MIDFGRDKDSVKDFETASDLADLVLFWYGFHCLAIRGFK